VYELPLDANSAVCSFVAEIDGTKVVGQVKEKKEAREIYDDAIAEGHGVCVLFFIFFTLFSVLLCCLFSFFFQLTDRFKLTNHTFDCLAMLIRCIFVGAEATQSV
jgi:hypothetical protein